MRIIQEIYSFWNLFPNLAIPVFLEAQLIFYLLVNVIAVVMENKDEIDILVNGFVKKQMEIHRTYHLH